MQPERRQCLEVFSNHVCSRPPSIGAMKQHFLRRGYWIRPSFRYSPRVEALRTPNHDEAIVTLEQWAILYVAASVVLIHRAIRFAPGGEPDG